MRTNTTFRLLSPALSALVLVAGGVATNLGGCSENGATVYDAPRDGDPVTAPVVAPTDPSTGEPAGGESPLAAAMEAAGRSAMEDETAYGEASDSPAEQSVISGDSPWIVPDGWRESADRPPMRHATYHFDDDDGEIEVAITRFPGDVGGMLANVNRWRGQVGLGPVTEADLPAMLDEFTNPGYVGHTIHLEGDRSDMLVASIYERNVDRTWFVRVIASPEVAQRVKDEVFAFAHTFGRTPD